MAYESNPSLASISTEFHSTHVESLRSALKTLDVNDEQAKVKVEIESSKVHWSELATSYCTAIEGPTKDSSLTSMAHEWVHEEGTPEWKLEVVEDNIRVFRSLQEKYPGGFFVNENGLGPSVIQQLPKWMMGRVDVDFGLSSVTPFAEGGQAQFFHAHRIFGGERKEGFVMKVFKEGTPLRDLLKFFPMAMLTNDETCTKGTFGSEGFANMIIGAQLLKSSQRFAFLMWRAWGDLRKLIDERMLYFNNQSLPFRDDVTFYILHHIATSVMELHERDIIHRDLKAANVLVFGKCGDQSIDLCNVDPVHLQPHEFGCLVADFECSVGVVGTRFWRAPEILEAVKNQSISQKPELFTKQADVYSFGMICYETLSSGIPFEKLQVNDYDSVIGGARPMLPSQTPPWMVDLVKRCWHKDPSMRPPFKEIVEVLKSHIPLKKKKKRIRM